MNPSKTIQAIIFDLDGVLTDTALYHFRAWKALADKLGVSFTEQDNEQLKGVDRLNSLRWIAEKGGLVLSADEEDRLMAQKNAHYLQLIQHMNQADLYPGVQPLFAAIKAKGWKIGLASASKNAAFVVDRLGVAADFDFVADANQVKNSKPDPEVFLLAAAGLEVAPGHCIGVEDAVAGIEAICAAGMRPVGIGEPALLAQASLVVPHIASLSIAQLQALA
ncbi:MAG: beta-phosphoglucomutase [Alkalimonas sp.]|nr:beta-phosphoglucomutase [Alkalimonas sp.]